MLLIRALTAFTFLWIVTCTTAFSTFGPVVGGARNTRNTARGASLPRTKQKAATPQLSMTLQDLPSIVVTDLLWYVSDTQIPLILFAAAFYFSVKETASNIGNTYSSMVGEDFKNVRKAYAEIVAQAEVPEVQMALFEVEDYSVPAQFTRQERLDLLAKAEYYEKEAVRARGGNSGKKRSVIGRILRPWKK
jgi:hypothetical protein